jgi:dihydroorotate dehydrogenase electron transfer subunit
MKEIAFIVENVVRRSKKIVEITLRHGGDEKLPKIYCGQFIHLQTGAGFGLRRPFCIHKFDEHTITIIVSIVGEGTKRLSALQCGAIVYGIAPLGNGFLLDGDACQKVALLGGGIGCAPLFSVQACYPKNEYRAFLGFATKSDDVFSKDFAAGIYTEVATNDGSYGSKGTAVDLLEKYIEQNHIDVVLACGPVGMLKAAAQLCRSKSVRILGSLEQRMGCGVGACLVCACAIMCDDGSEIKYQRVCADGPVFDLSVVIF